MLLLLRNPIDTIISLMNMNPKIGVKKSIQEIIEYWKTTANNLKKINCKNLFYVNYEKLTASPIEVTRQIFRFIDSVQEEGVDTYSKPTSYQWQWKKDDGGDVIKSLKVQKNKPDYSKYQEIIEEILSDKELAELANHFGFELK